VYTAIEGAKKTGGGVGRNGCGLAELHQHRLSRGDMEYLDNFASKWEMSPPKRNPDDVGFDDLDDDVEEEENFDEDEEEDEEDEEEDEEDDLDEEDEDDDEEDVDDEEDFDDEELDEDFEDEDDEE
jgi:hypothetical protein